MSTLKECKVVMLPSKKQEYQVKQGSIFINDTSQYNWGALEALYCERITVNGHAWNNGGIKTNIQHLYILSNDEIKEGDYIIHKDYKSIKRAKSTLDNGYLDWLKIIATTDKELSLPSVSTGFVEKYCELRGIDTIMVQYEDKGYSQSINDGEFIWIEKLVPYVSNDNTITIKPVKDSWTREELYQAMQYYMEFCKTKEYVTPEHWYNNLKHY